MLANLSQLHLMPLPKVVWRHSCHPEFTLWGFLGFVFNHDLENYSNQTRTDC